MILTIAVMIHRYTHSNIDTHTHITEGVTNSHTHTQGG